MVNRTRRNLLGLSVGGSALSIATALVRQSPNSGLPASPFVRSLEPQQQTVLASRTLDEPSQAKPLISVRDFGAVGDGISDDTMALNNAFTSADEINLWFPAGVYMITSPIGRNFGRVQMTGASGSVIKASATYESGQNREMLRLAQTDYVLISGLTFDGSSRALNGGLGFPDSSNGITAIAINSPEGGLVSVVGNTILDFPESGIHISGGAEVLVAQNTISNGMFHGISIGGGSGAKTGVVRVSGNTISGRGDQGASPTKGGIGILVTRVEEAEIASNTIHNMADTGTKAEGCPYVTYVDNVVVDSGKDGLKVQPYGTDFPTVKRATITGNTVKRINAWRSDGAALLLLDSVERANVSDNRLEGGGTRRADSIRCVRSSISPLTDISIHRNSVFAADAAAIRVTNTSVGGDPLGRLEISENHADGPIVVSGPVAQDLSIIRNTIDNRGILRTDTYGISATQMAGRKIEIADNDITDFLGGPIVSVLGGKNIRLLTMSRNAIRDCSDWGCRALAAGSGTATIEILDMSYNTFAGTSKAGSPKPAIIRVDVTSLAIQSMRVTGNLSKRIGSIGIVALLQITGGNHPIALLHYSENAPFDLDSHIILGESFVVRIIGYARASAPNWGTWDLGDYIRNSGPRELGPLGSHYVVQGFRCVASGSPGRWVEERMPIGQ
ncbi:right-handed parallel beta-helix repeat-containing protein [Arthrobacter halodurans]|uniref:Right-handed parallel beta-helix repeat-containing protein n=1 Tax=Arthrobacter halodurans TaxID=516699 RepID=A0ABV4UM05_9MICC